MPLVWQARDSRARALLQPWLQGPRPPQMARRRLPHCGPAGRRAGPLWQGGQRRERRLGSASLLRALPGSVANAQVAQLVEHVTENHGVGGAIPPLGTTAPFNLGLLKPSSHLIVDRRLQTGLD